MKLKVYFLLLLIVPFLALNSVHKYYVSVTQIEYKKEEASVQIISRIFIDDFENLIRKRYDESIILAGKNEPKIANTYIERYLKDKIKITINNKEVELNFLGKEYDADIMRCYLEIEGVKDITSIQITNQLLFDLYSEQQNIVKTKINSKQKSFLLILQKDEAVLNFN